MRDDLEFIEGLTADPDWHGLLVVATARPSIGARVDADWTRLELAPLAGRDAHALVDALVGDALPAELLERIVARSDGNPLFIEELLRTWVSIGTLDRPDPGGRWRLTAPATDIPLPTTIQSIYASQLDDMSGEARLAARRAAVAGRRFPIDVLPELGTADSAAAVAELGRRAVVSGPQGDALLGDTYGYRHALVRDAAYASLARAERADLHVRLAAWLEDVAGIDAGLIAAVIGGQYADALANASALTATVGAGLSRSDVAERAATWLERAGDRAIATAAYDAARADLGRAVELTPEDDAPALGRRLTRLGDSFAGTGSLDLAVDAYQRAVSTLEAALVERAPQRAAGDPARRSLAAAARALGHARFEQTRFAEAVAVADRALALVGDDEGRRLPLELLALEARNALSNDPSSLLAEAARLRDRAGAQGDPDLALAAMHTEVRIRSEVGQATSEDFRALADRFEERGRWREATSALVNAMKLAVDDETFGSVAGRAAVSADAHGLRESQVWIALLRAERDLVSGDWERATLDALAGIEIGEANAYHRAVVRSWSCSGRSPPPRRPHHARARRDVVRGTQPGEHLPDSPYGRLMHAAIDVDLASVGLRDADAPTLARLESGFGLPYDSPDWLLAIERVVGAMLDAGLIDDVRTAIALVPPPTPERDPLTAVSDALTRSWVHEADADRVGAIASARAGLAMEKAASAPWWTCRLLEVLERADAVDFLTRMKLARIRSGCASARWPTAHDRGCPEATRGRHPGASARARQSQSVVYVSILTSKSILLKWEAETHVWVSSVHVVRSRWSVE